MTDGVLRLRQDDSSLAERQVIVRREHTTEKKRQIVEETFLPGASVSIIARKYNLNANQVFKWRQLYKRGKLGRPIGSSSSQFITAGIVGDNGQLLALKEPPMPTSEPVTSPAVARASGPSASSQGIIEVILHHGVRVRFEGNVELSVLNHVLTTAARLS